MFEKIKCQMLMTRGHKARLYQQGDGSTRGESRGLCLSFLNLLLPVGFNGGLAPPLSIADTPWGGARTINLSPYLLAGTGHSSLWPRPLVGAGRASHSHARVGPALELTPFHPWSPGIQGPLGGSHGQRGERGRGKGARG